MADLKQIKVGSTTYNIEPYTNYLPLAGGHMSGDIKMTENSTSIIFRSASADWYSGIYANSTGDEVLGIVVSNPRTHIMLGNADVSERPACTALTPAIDIKNGKVGINKRLGTDGAADAGSYNLDVNGSVKASSIQVDNLLTGSIQAGDIITSSISHPGDGLYIGDPNNVDYVYVVEDMRANSENWSLSQDGDLNLEGTLYVSSGMDIGGDSYISGDLTVGNGGVSTQGDLVTASDLQVDGNANIGGQIIGKCLLNSTSVTLSTSSSIYIPLNTYLLNVNSSTTYIHRGPTGTYTVTFPSMSCQVVTSSTSNMGTATYKVGSTTQTQNSLSGTAQGGGSSYNASVNIPSKSFSVSLTYGQPYTVSVTYTKSSYVSSITSYGSYGVGTIYVYPTSSTYSQGTIGIGVGGSGSPYVYRGQTNIGGESNISYEVALGASGKTYVYLSSPTASWAYVSDRRDKSDIENIQSSLGFINKLQPVTYVENLRENYINDDGTFNEESYEQEVFKKHRRRAGFIAQDVYQVLKEEYQNDNYAAVVDYNKYKNEEDGFFDRYSFNGNQLIPFLVKAIQEQQEIIESQNIRITELEKVINKKEEVL